MPKQYFTLLQANQMVPRLEAAFSLVMQLRAQLKRLYRTLDNDGFAPSGDEFEIDPEGAPPDVVQKLATFKGLVSVMRDELASIQHSGCMIKDIETGLVDWFAKKDGEDILLCWRYGEKEVLFWHDLDSGYAGRRPVSELED